MASAARGTSPTDTDSRALARKNGRTLGLTLGIVVGMVGLSFAAVPLYDLFCRVTGFGGTTQVATGAADTVLDRTMRVRFTADADGALPWQFRAEQTEITVNVGGSNLVFYSATNTGDAPVAGTAVYNVNPPKMGRYFYKVQCFCFEEQIIMPGETVEFPVYFYLDAGLDEDRNIDDVPMVTLSYRFFPSESDALDRAQDEFYRAIEAENSVPTPQANATAVPAANHTASVAEGRLILTARGEPAQVSAD